MKLRRILYFGYLAWLAVPMTGFGAEAGADPAAAAAPKAIDVQVKSMVCGFCAQGAVKALRANPAVGSVSVQLESHRVRIYPKPGLAPERQLSDAAIAQVFADSKMGDVTITREN